MEDWRRNEKSEEERWQLPYEYPFGDRTKEEGRDTVKSVITIYQKPFYSVETIGMSVWDGCLVLCKYLEYQCCRGSLTLQGKRCIELGRYRSRTLCFTDFRSSGTGLLGIVAALLGAETIVTDYDCKEVLELMDSNIKLNTKPELHKISVKPLLWGSSVTSFSPPFDIIVAAELIYDEDVVVPLVTSLNDLSDRNSIILVSFDTHRDNEETVDLFYKETQKYFKYDQIPSSEMDPIFKSDAIVILQLTKY